MNEERIFTMTRCLGEGVGVRSTARIIGASKNTVLRWTKRIGPHVSRLFQTTLRELWPNEVQLDELWSFLTKKQGNLSELEALQEELGDCWVWVAFDPESKVVLGFILGKRTKENAIRLLERVRNVLGEGCFPLFTSDELASYEDALVEVFGITVQPERKGQRGRLPNPRKVPGPELKYGTVCKEREGSRVVKVSTRVVFGDDKAVNADLKRSTFSKRINTAAVERENGKLRSDNGRLVRKTHGFSKDLEYFENAVNITLGYDHFCRPHKGLQIRVRGEDSGGVKRWERRTPMMAIGVTSHVWSVRELLMAAISSVEAEVAS